jgi:hypothetical protein
MAKQLSNGTGVKIGQGTTDTVGFYGTAGIARSASTFAMSAPPPRRMSPPARKRPSSL